MEFSRRRSIRPGWELLARAAVTGLALLGWAVPGARAQDLWHLSDRPTLVIGSADGPREFTFHDVRGAVAATRDLIVVADGGSRELRVFSSRGDFVRSFGGMGDGPAEFRRLDWIDMCGGPTIVAYDSFRYRITRWDVAGSLVEGFQVDGPLPDLPPYEVRCSVDRRFVVLGWPNVRLSRSVGPYRPSVPLGIADSLGRRIRVLDEVLGAERIRTEANDRPHPFGSVTTVRMGLDGVYVGTGEAPTIRRMTPDGGETAFTVGPPVAELSANARERWIDEYLRRAPADERPLLKRGFMASEWVPDVPPAYRDFSLDRLGYLWLAPYAIGGPEYVDWHVFDPLGESAAAVRMPRDFRPTEIGPDYLLGEQTDALGVERVLRYALHR